MCRAIKRGKSCTSGIIFKYSGYRHSAVVCYLRIDGRSISPHWLGCADIPLSAWTPCYACRAFAGLNAVHFAQYNTTTSGIINYIPYRPKLWFILIPLKKIVLQREHSASGARRLVWLTLGIFTQWASINGFKLLKIKCSRPWSTGCTLMKIWDGLFFPMNLSFIDS
jgi:hypothetical protein